MTTFDFNAISSALDDPGKITSGVDFSGKSLKLDTASDAQPIVDAINKCPNLQYLTLTGNTLGVAAAEAIAGALESRPELKEAHFSDMFTGRMKTEIPPALSALGEGMIKAGARLSSLDLSDNAFGPIGVEGLARLLQSDVCGELEELRLNNNGLGITGGRLLARALGARPRRLRVFVAGRNRLENDGASALAQVFQNMGTLEEVSMPQNGIYHVGIGALSEAFKHNPALSRLNLNDNTIGGKGAASLAQAMPRLRNLKCINFGDCLLKSKGAKELAKALKDNSMSIELLDLSHNEIGREACMEVADALTALPDSSDRLARVVLAGNSLGNASSRRRLRDKLGDAAELSDGEGSDDEYVTDSDNSDASETESEAGSEQSEGDTTQPTLKDLNISLDTSVEEVETDVARFLEEPTEDNLKKLGPRAAELIDTHLQAIKDPADFIQAYVEAVLLVSGVPSGRVSAPALYRQLNTRAAERHAMQWQLADNVLRGLALIKSENKNFRIRWSLPEAYAALADVIAAPAFPPALRDTLRFFISSKLASLPEEVQAIVKAHPTLLS